MGNNLKACADKIINICHVLKALPKGGAFSAYRRKLFAELQRLALSVGLEDRMDEYNETDHPRGENGQFKEKGGSADNSTFLREVGKRPFVKGSPYPLKEISAEGANKPCQGFTKNNLVVHKDTRHKEQYANLSYQQYEDRARRLLEKKCGPDIWGYRTSNGCICRFNRLTGEYAKGFPGGNILTCFYPTRMNQADKTKIDLDFARDYFNRQKRVESYD